MQHKAWHNASTTTSAERINYRELAVFLLPAFGLAIANLIVNAKVVPASRLGMAFFVVWFQWSPGVAAIATCLIFHRDLREIGWRLPPLKYLLMGCAVPLVWHSLALGGALAFGWASLNTTLLASPANLLGIAVRSLAGASVGALGEEIGWRGFLVPRLSARLGYVGVSLVSGTIWAVWHYADFLIVGPDTLPGPLLHHMASFTVSVVGISFAYTWLRQRSRSIWPGVCLHAVCNAFVWGILEPLTVPTDANNYLLGVNGSLPALVSCLFALLFYLAYTLEKRRLAPSQTYASHV